MECVKCKSNAVFWHNEKYYDPITQDLIDGYFQCLMCAKVTFESCETKQTLERDKTIKTIKGSEVHE